MRRPRRWRRTGWRLLLAVVVLVVGTCVAALLLSGRHGGRPVERVVAGVYTTGYTWYDNTPPGSGRISNPRVHTRAGGTGTFDDPITMAVGHSLATGHDVLDIAAGTKFYLPHVRRYFVVEDTCGDGPTPQNRGCHNLGTAAAGAQLWVDLYVGGSAADSKTVVQSCAGKVTDGDKALHVMVADPSPDHLVVTGPLFQGGACTSLYPDTALPAAH